MAIVPINVNYTYNILRQNLITLLSKYPFINVQVVGKSVMGKNIYVCKLGNGSKKVFYSIPSSLEYIFRIFIFAF